MSKISDYFKANKNSNLECHEDLLPEENSKTTHEEFYKNALLEQMNQCSEECDVDKKRIKIKISDTLEKIKKIEDAIKTARDIVGEKEKLITELNFKLSPQPHQQTKCVTPMFQVFDNLFDSDQLAKLRSFKLLKGEDAPFIRHIVQFLYSGNLKSLKIKTVCGRNVKGSESKEKMTPEKHQTVEKMFVERLSQLESSERSDRFKRLNRLMKKAFANISKAEEMKNTEKKTCENLFTALSDK